MLSVLVLLGGTFAFLVSRAHRRARSQGYHPEGKLRWNDDPREDDHQAPHGT